MQISNNTLKPKTSKKSKLHLGIVKNFKEENQKEEEDREEEEEEEERRRRGGGIRWREEEPR